MTIRLFCLLMFAASCVSAEPIRGINPTSLTTTEELQGVIDRGDKLVYVPTGRYVVSKSIFLRSNMTLFCEQGAILEAAPGSFLEATDKPEASILVLDRVENVAIFNCVIRGRKPDYGVYRVRPDGTYDLTPNALGYVPGEFRHAIRITGSSRVNLYNVTANSSGGDGLYIGPHVLPDKTRVPCNNVTVRNSVFSDNHRQGISVLACLGECLIEDCVMSMTKGASPQAGIDIEPENGDVVEITVRRCQSIGNRGSAYLVSLLNTKPTDAPSSVIFESCGSFAVPPDQQVLRLANVVSQVGQIMPNLPVGTVVQFDNLVWRK